ncbi:hypothetical protein FKM82_005564 [Ascaphus truei]
MVCPSKGNSSESVALFMTHTCLAYNGIYPFFYHLGRSLSKNMPPPYPHPITPPYLHPHPHITDLRRGVGTGCVAPDWRAHAVSCLQSTFLCLLFLSFANFHPPPPPQSLSSITLPPQKRTEEGRGKHIPKD